MEMPRFVIKTPSSMFTAKAAHTKLSNEEKLQAFVELACHCYAEIDGSNVMYIDASNTSNVEKATKWFNENLGFLSNGDASDLMDFWRLAIENGNKTRPLFDCVKALQAKYA